MVWNYLNLLIGDVIGYNYFIVINIIVLYRFYVSVLFFDFRGLIFYKY